MRKAFVIVKVQVIKVKFVDKIEETKIRYFFVTLRCYLFGLILEVESVVKLLKILYIGWRKRIAPTVYFVQGIE